MSEDDILSEEEKEDLIQYEEAQRARRQAGQDIELEVFDAVRAPDSESPVTTVRLKGGDSLQFRCHRGVACWNKCCHGADITLTPGDVPRLSKRLEIEPTEFLETYTVPAIWEKADLPVAKMKMGGEEGKGPCPFVSEEGCTVYSDRPVTCRYYPLGLVSLKLKDTEDKEVFQFLVREAHCCGHDEDKVQTVDEFRVDQGLEDYENVNQGWIDILMKSASWATVGGPFHREMSPQVKQMFFMVSTDVAKFRQFVFGTRFLDTYEIDPEAVEIIKTDDAALLLLGFDWMKNVMFKEPTIAMRETVLQGAIAKAREDMGAV